MHLSQIMVASCAAVLLAVGCSGDTVAENIAENALEDALGGEADVDFDEDGGITVETSEGTFEQNIGGSVPDDFPANVPLLDFEVQHSLSMTDDEVRGWTVTMAGTGSATAIAETIKSDFADAGFSVSNESTSTSDDHVTITMFFESETHTAIVGVNENADAGETIVSYIVNEVDATS
ncbi:MAG: hypothetical protein R3249_07545 [Nitriliruptorales bacterium]|nr:hypothetical protein [Nitriliruptorales bacterium]